ncbi:acylphosphatase [Gulosibacter chungangensis]|uniref:acylphosphatase n=1 Tax=Gulosibacter chungangensis TaxID=979746 RepID=A0A7J5BC39_9MICO|nr:acylphosphatase [Gulosibacter chungangensis]KAB1643391.1 acylphosphatase [Gulosibacter chungangensis]
MKSVHVVISGRVQGVGYRYSTRQAAEDRRVTGWVRNLADGRVEAEFHGSTEAVDALLAWCEQGPPAARVESVGVTPLTELERDTANQRDADGVFEIR